MSCKRCGSLKDNFFGYCNACVQSLGYFDKYPGLFQILSEKSISLLKDHPVGSDELILEVKCQVCERQFSIALVNILKQYRRNSLQSTSYFYHCHRCSKKGKSGIGLYDVMPVIDIEETTKRFGGLPKSARTGKVVAKCEDCYKLFELKLGNLLHQSRRHRSNGRTCLYKCFQCGIQRKDAVEKSAIARASQLSKGFRSGLEIAAANRLDFLGIKYEQQFIVGIYTWDFFIPEYDILIDVDGEYWHSLPKRSSLDRSKVTYTNHYYPQYKIIRIEEKNFLNPLTVDKIIQEALGTLPPIVQINFQFSDIMIEKIGGNNEPMSKYANFLNSYHYAQCGRAGRAVYGAFLNEKLVAVCKFNSVTRMEVASSLGLKCTQVLELDRFCIHPNHQKKNFASWMISRCVKSVFLDHPNVLELVSFADETFGHSGTIYKAANWKLIGKTKPSYHYMGYAGVPINKKRVYDIASKLRMREKEYAEKHDLIKFSELPKSKFVLKRT